MLVLFRLAEVAGFILGFFESLSLSQISMNSWVTTLLDICCSAYEFMIRTIRFHLRIFEIYDAVIGFEGM